MNKLAIRSVIVYYMDRDWALVLAMGPGNPPAVRVWTGKTIRFGS